MVMGSSEGVRWSVKTHLRIVCEFELSWDFAPSKLAPIVIDTP